MKAMLIGRASKAVLAFTVVTVALTGAPAAGLSARAQEAAPLAPELTGLGTMHMQVTTGVPRAQIFFDQGLRLLYAFNHTEAIRAFREAARLDPGLAMAYWGRALALGPNLNAPMTEENGRQAYAAIQQAIAAAAGATPRERALVDALALRYAPDGKGDRPALDRAYAAAMQTVAERFPDDPDIQTIAADAQMNTMPWDYWQKDGSAKPETARTLDRLERVIAAHPQHAGALHYHIHLLEASPDPDRAERSADRLGDLMPAAGHMVHMPAHIYLRVGRYADAAEANERAIRADEDYLAQCQTQGLYPVSYYPHNLHFLWAAATLEGRRAVAVDAARKVAAKVPHHHAGALSWTADFPVTPMLAYARFGLWQDVLTEPQPPANQPYAVGIWHYTRGLALVARARLEPAAAELSALKKVMAHEAFATTLKDLPLLTNLQIASRTLEGELALRRGDADAAIALLREAVTIEDGIPYNEPPVWHQPPRQVLGAVLIEAGRAAEAERVYREDLKRFRENGWSLFGLAQSLDAQQRTSEAADVRRRFEKAWARADIELTSSRVMGAGPAATRSAAHGVHEAHVHAASREREIELADGTRLAYVEHGDAGGTPVVLLHGYTDSWRSYERVLPYLPSSLRVFALTQRGHGNSAKPGTGAGSRTRPPGDEYSPAAFARDVAAFLDAVGVERAIVVGHSMGATVAQRFAVDYPGRTRALVLEGAFVPRPGNVEIAKFWEAVSALADPIDAVFVREFQQSTLAQPVPPEFFETAVSESLKVPARVWKGALQPFLTTDFVAALANINVPTLIVWGDRDAFTSRREQDELTKAIPASRLVVYEGAGHSPHWEEPQRFALQVSSFIAGLSQATATPYVGPVTALMAAVWDGRSDDVRVLLAQGADPDSPVGTPPLTAWQVAVLAGDQPSLASIAARGGHRPKAHYTPALFKAALQQGDARLAADFIEAGASLVFGDAEYAPLSLASANGHVEVMRELLDAGAFIDLQDRFGDTALMAAVRSGHLDAVRLLLDRNANTRLIDVDGPSAAGWAVRMGRPGIIAALDPGLPQARQKNGRANRPQTTIRTAAARGLTLLEQGGADWNGQKPCDSCHHQGLLAPVVAVARERGFVVDEDARDRVERGRRWLLSAPAATTLDKTYRLLGLYWAGADHQSIRTAAKSLIEEQDPHGAWAPSPGLNPDAYATGLALVALHDAGGLTSTDAAYRQGIAYLLRTQQGDGSWFVHKRAASFDEYFESGLPHGKHQFSSFAGTAWATMALMYASGPEENRDTR